MPKADPHADYASHKTPREAVPLYDELSAEYDAMVAWEERLRGESPFFEAAFQQVGARRVLDVGCGTGWHAIHFARLGLETVGADPSAEMIHLAKENARGQERVRFVLAGFGQLRARVGGTFDVVTCLGNTLPHLLTEAELQTALEDVAGVLRPGGLLIVQQLNYDRILAQRQRFLGVTPGRIGGQELLFFRFYDFEEPPFDPAQGPLLTFNVVTFRREGQTWDFRVRSTRLWPIRSEQILRLLPEVGFGQVELYGDYARSKYQPLESNDLVIVAVRL